MLPAENGDRIAALLRSRPDFRPVAMSDAWAGALPDVEPPAAALVAGGPLLLTPRRTNSDGFFLNVLARIS